MRAKVVVDGGMTATPRRSVSILSFALVCLVGILPSPTIASEPRAAAAQPSNACEHPCVHVEDCPKITCECAEASASGVAACDADETHCCLTASAACERFCEVNHQTWTGRYTPEGDARPKPAASAPEAASDTTPSAAPACADTCEKADDCPTITCQCAKGLAEHVAACDAKTHCCGGARVVCEHFCVGKKGKWTGKVAESAPPARDSSPSLRELYGDGDGDSLGRDPGE
jgi:hypothetical protein